MTQGRLIAVVGPSGVGKDSVMSGLKDAWPALHVVRRMITRAPGLGGECYDSVSVADFDAMADRHAFALHWGAHGLQYGVPSSVRDQLQDGRDCLVNLSRSVLAQADAAFPRFVVLHITASSDTLRRRLAARGRETEAEIARRLSVAEKPLPDGLTIKTVSNDGPLAETVAAALAALQPVRA